MATKTYYVTNTVADNFAALDETMPGSGVRALIWTVAKTAAGNSSEADVGVTQAASTFTSNTTTPKPSGLITGSTANALRTPTTLSGTFAATAWSFSLGLIGGVISGTPAGRCRLRVYKGTDQTGIGASELTGATLVTSAVTLGTSAAASTVTWSPGAVTLSDEYLFFAVAWEITVAAGSNSTTGAIWNGNNFSGNSPSTILTPDLSAGAAAAATPRPIVIATAVQRAAVR